MALKRRHVLTPHGAYVTHKRQWATPSANVRHGRRPSSASTLITRGRVGRVEHLERDRAERLWAVCTLTGFNPADYRGPLYFSPSTVRTGEVLGEDVEIKSVGICSETVASPSCRSCSWPASSTSAAPRGDGRPRNSAPSPAPCSSVRPRRTSSGARRRLHRSQSSTWPSTTRCTSPGCPRRDRADARRDRRNATATDADAPLGAAQGHPRRSLSPVFF